MLYSGSSEECLDQLAFELMIPIATLKEYMGLVSVGWVRGEGGSGWVSEG